MNDVTLEVPPLATTSLTGFLGASEREIRSTKWRVELYTYAPRIRIQRNGAAVEWAQCGNESRRFINRVVRTFNQAHSLTAAAVAADANAVEGRAA